MNTSPKINQLVSTSDGVAVARISMQNIAVISGPGAGSKFINVQDGERLTVFLLDKDQCKHLAHLLCDEPCSITVIAEVH